MKKRQQQYNNLKHYDEYAKTFLVKIDSIQEQMGNVSKKIKEPK